MRYRGDRADSANRFDLSAVELVNARPIIGMIRDGDNNVLGLYRFPTPESVEIAAEFRAGVR